MTDDPNDDLEARLRRDLGTIADAVPDTPVVVPMTAAPRRRVGVGLAAAAVVAVVGLVAAAVWWGGNDPDGTGPAASTSTAPTAPTTTTKPVDSAPPSGTGSYRLWLSTDSVSTAGSNVIFAVLGQPADLEWESGFWVDEWDGKDWQPVAQGGSCEGFLHCWGDLGDFGEDLRTKRQFRSFIGGGPGVGRAEYVHLDGLDPGWHRIRQTIAGELATGVFRVVEQEAMPVVASLAPVEEDSLLIEPVLAAPEGSIVSVTPAMAAPANRLGDPEPVSRLDRWNGIEWVEMLSFDTPYATVELRVPALGPGPYRLVRGRTGGADLIGNFWVVESVPDAVECHVLPTLDELLGADATAFDGPTPPTEPLRSSFTPGGFRVQWDSPDTTITYSYPAGSVIDLVGERTVQDGPLLLWYQSGFGDTPSTIEAWVELPECGEGFDLAGFTVTGGSEEENVALALRLGRALAERYNPDFEVEPRTDCSAEDTPAPATTETLVDLWVWCRTSLDAEPELVPVKKTVNFFGSMSEALRPVFGQPPDGFESAVPIELWAAAVEVSFTGEGVRTIHFDIDYDFAAAPINNFSASSWSGRYLAQIAANAFQFATIDAIDLDTLCCGEWEGLYTRADWEEWKAAQAE